MLRKGIVRISRMFLFSQQLLISWQLHGKREGHVVLPYPLDANGIWNTDFLSAVFQHTCFLVDIKQDDVVTVLVRYEEEVS